MGVSLGNSTLCVIDFETTGVAQGYKNEPWQIGLVYIKEGLIDSNSMWEQYIHIDENRPFNQHVPGRHSQIRDILKNSPNKHEVFNKLKNKLPKDGFVAHNCSTEKKMLKILAPLHLFGPWIDTLKISKEAWPNLKGYSLEELVIQLQLQNRIDYFLKSKTFHDALYDAVATASIIEKLVADGWGNISLSELVLDN